MNKFLNLDPDAYSTYAQICARYGFNYQTHQVTTDDGYLLTVMHITSKTVAADGPVVFLQHGLISSAETWIMNAENSPAFRLAREGFDVWLGNNRGTLYSRKNIHFSADKDPADFFNYSFYELGQYDAPAQIDFVRKQTGQSKISYIGHSQGTTQMYSALTENHGDLQDKLNIFVALAPVVNLHNSPNSMLVNASKLWRQLEPAAKKFKAYEIRNPATDKALKLFCGTFSSLCGAITGFLNMEASPYNVKQAEEVQDARAGSAASLG